MEILSARTSRSTALRGALSYFRGGGFSGIEVNELDHDIQNYWYVCRA